ncbi:GPH family glycoside/pentoside/hexuronide:cation symporter [Kordia periserrulae]|uniref:GPH family glycoside/pentoside/hexuronide:cation symporter n=1 Tax=Kordia periserrulae TaxID=701523 RepID=A0A2T6BYD1_9FLAO|nr:MFS transporter [Kordia periserrulae]PTX61082.1 GPH family glycoside/pentoside/hexuronide:cation symporter [Kordia periserrulae]
MATHKKLSLREKIGYALGDTAANIAWRTVAYFLPIFYTDVFGLEAAVAATLIFLIRLTDGVTDLIMGNIADRTKSKYGKFRPWLLWTALPFAVALILQFTTPDLSLTGKVIWAYATSIFYTLTYTANNVPYSALMGVMTSDVKVRTELSSYRFFGAYLGGIIATIGVIALVDYLGDGNQNIGYQYTMYVLAFILAGCSLITFYTTRERVPVIKTSNLKDDYKDLIKNVPWLILLLIGFIFVTYNVIKQSTTMYYFSHYVNDEQNIFGSLVDWGGKKGLAGLYLLSLLVISMISTVFAPALTRFFGKVKLFIMSIVFSAITAGAMYWLEANQVGSMFTLGILSEFGAGLMPVLFFAMLGDAADYSEYKNKRRATGLVYSAGTFAMKFGGGMAGFITLMILNMYNYDGEAVVKTPEMLEGIKLNMSIVPAIFVLVGVIALWFYPLTSKKMEVIEAELEERRAAKVDA